VLVLVHPVDYKLFEMHRPSSLPYPMPGREELNCSAFNKYLDKVEL